MRLPEGFAKVRFYGGGFELDNVSISEAVPDASNTESNFIGTPPSPPDSITMHAPSEVPVDPRANQVGLPELPLSGSTDATVCYRQVADLSGTALSPATINFGTLTPASVELVGPYFAIHGSLSQTQSATGSVVIGKNDYTRVTLGGPVYIEVSALPVGTVPTEAGCAASTTKYVIEVRPLDLTEIVKRPVNFYR
jgi:hypothetical protein